MMTTLLSIVGEQPMPVLLPDRLLQPTRTLLVCTARSRPVAMRLQRLLPHAVLPNETQDVEPYELATILAQLGDVAPPAQPMIVNLTGGTKMMMLGAFALAMQRGWEFVYLESERLPATLYRYTFASGALRRKEKTPLPPLITAADYLRAHLPGFRSEGFSRDRTGALNDGGRFEQAVYDALTPHVDEVLAGVRPEGVADQIEMDLVIRIGNQVGVAEVKLGGSEERPKQGIDQLSTATSREYLGIYTARFLITANPLANSILRLAKEKQINVITLQSYRLGAALTPDDQQRLVQAIRGKLAP